MPLLPLLPIAEQYLRVHDLNIRYCVAGSGEPLLLVHGLGAMIEYWYKNIEVLAQKYQVIAFDLPGFGKSNPLKTGNSIDYYVDFINDFLTTLQVNQFSAVAHSLGGALMLRYTSLHQHRLKKLILISNVGFNAQLSGMFRLLTLPGSELLISFSREKYAATLRAHTVNFETISETFIDIAYEIAKQVSTQQVFLKILRQNASIFGIRQKTLQSIQQGFSALADLPMQIYWGTQDPILFFEPHTQAANKLLPRVPIVALEQCGHIPQLEKSEIINDGILKFLNS